ncbi:MAG: ABC transporter substrate-binding protein [Microthrixaceae bacterium]
MAAVAVGMVASSCGGGGGSGDDTSGGPVDEGTPVSGGRVVYGLEAETNGGWCLPEAQLAIAGIQVAKTIYDTLVAPDETGKMQPLLAESVEPNDAFDEWTITLREGVKFHDGTDLTAEVVKNNLDAFRGQYEGRSSLLFTFVLQDIDSIEAPDDLTVTVKLKRPWVAFDSFLYSSGRFGMMAQAQLDDPDNCDKNLIGTGPFKLKEWKPNDSFVAEKNPDYWQTDADGNQLPYLDEIEYRPLADTDRRIEGLTTGQFDMIHTQGGEANGQLQPEADAGTIEVTANSDWAEVTYFMFNESKPPFDNKDARLAVAHAIDREEFKKLRTSDLQQVASGPFAPDTIGYVEDAGMPEFDVAKAKEHAAAYKEATGEDLSFTFTYGSDPSTLTSVELIQSQLAEADINLQIATTDQAALIDRAIGGDFELLYWRNHPGGDPDGQYVWWQSGSLVNFGKIDDPEIDKLLEAGREETDAEARAAIYEDLNKRFGSEVHNMWMTWSLWSIASKPEVNGVLGPPVNGEPPFTGLASGTPVTGLWVDGGGE